MFTYVLLIWFAGTLGGPTNMGEFETLAECNRALWQIESQPARNGRVIRGTCERFRHNPQRLW